MPCGAAGEPTIARKSTHARAKVRRSSASMLPHLASPARSVAGLVGTLAIAGAACGGRALDPSIFVWSATTGADDESTTSTEETSTGDPASTFCAGAVSLRYDPAA